MITGTPASAHNGNGIAGGVNAPHANTVTTTTTTTTNGGMGGGATHNNNPGYASTASMASPIKGTTASSSSTQTAGNNTNSNNNNASLSSGGGTVGARRGMGAPALGVPTVIDYGRYRFLITDCPDDRTMGSYIELMKDNRVAHIGRACEPSYYSSTPLSTAGIQVHEFMFEDGSPPPPLVLRKWLDLVEGCFVNRKSPDFLNDNQRVGVHCVAGLGRAPVLVAVALIEAGMNPLEAAQYVRARRKGALNTVQLHWLETYSRQRRWNTMAGDRGNEGGGASAGGGGAACCVLC